MSSYAALDDGTLIEKTLDGHSECFGVLMNRHLPAVRSRVRSMARNEFDQDDLVQETFMKAWRNLGGFRADASFKTWLLRVATNEVLQNFRREQRKRTGSAEEGLDAFVSSCESPHDAMERAEAHRTIRRAAADLPPIYRQVLILRELDELTTQETARWLRSGIPLVKSRLLRARKMLATAVRGNG